MSKVTRWGRQHHARADYERIFSPSRTSLLCFATWGRAWESAHHRQSLQLPVRLCHQGLLQPSNITSSLGSSSSFLLTVSLSTPVAIGVKHTDFLTLVEAASQHCPSVTPAQPVHPPLRSAPKPCEAFPLVF